MENITIKKIAELAGISTTTVSRFLNNNTKKMSDKTKEKIEKIIEEYNYSPNKLAQGLAKKTSKFIGVSIADINNPFSSVMISAISKICEEKGYNLIFSNSSNNPAIERDAITNFISYRVDGIIINTTGDNDMFIKNLNFSNLMFIDRPTEYMFADTVTSNNYESTNQMLEYIYSLDYKQVYFLTLGLEDISTRKIRFQGFKDTVFQKQNLSAKEIEKLHINIKKEEKKLLKIINHNLKENIKTAFFSVNGETLIKFLEILKKNKIKIGGNLGVASHEYWKWTDLYEPKITVVNQDSYKIGAVCATKLIEKIESKRKRKNEVKLIEIKSTIEKGDSL